MGTFEQSADEISGADQCASSHPGATKNTFSREASGSVPSRPTVTRWSRRPSLTTASTSSSRSTEKWDTIWVVSKGDTANIPYWPNYVAVSDQDFVCRYTDYNVLNVQGHTPLYVDDHPDDLFVGFRSAQRVSPPHILHHDKEDPAEGCLYIVLDAQLDREHQCDGQFHR